MKVPKMIFSTSTVLFASLLTGCNSSEAPPAEAPPTEQAKPAEKDATNEAPPAKERPVLNKELLKKMAENRALVPSPVEMQKALKQGGINQRLAELVPERNLKMDVPNVDQVAVRTGVVIADLLLTVGDADKMKIVEDLKKIKKGMSQLGAGDDIPKTIEDLVNRVQNDSVERNDLIKELDDLSGAIIPEITYEAGERSVPLIQAGSWLEGANLVARAIDTSGKHKVADDLLRQASVVEYFQEYVATEGQDKAPGEVIAQLEKTLKILGELSAKESLTPEDVKLIQKSTSAVLDLL